MLSQPPGFHALRRVLRKKNAHVDRAAMGTLQDLRARSLDNAKLHTRMATLECYDYSRKRRGCRAIRPNDDVLYAAFDHRRHVTLHGICAGQNLAGVLVNHGTGVSGGHTTTVTLNQSDPERVFEPAELGAHSGLSEVELLGRVGDAPVLHDSLENTELIEANHQSLCKPYESVRLSYISADSGASIIGSGSCAPETCPSEEA